jgi:hypothetical protein
LKGYVNLNSIYYNDQNLILFSTEKLDIHFILHLFI